MRKLKKFITVSLLSAMVLSTTPMNVYALDKHEVTSIDVGEKKSELYKKIKNDIKNNLWKTASDNSNYNEIIKIETNNSILDKEYYCMIGGDKYVLSSGGIVPINNNYNDYTKLINLDSSASAEDLDKALVSSGLRYSPVNSNNKVYTYYEDPEEGYEKDTSKVVLNSRVYAVNFMNSNDGLDNIKDLIAESGVNISNKEKYDGLGSLIYLRKDKDDTSKVSFIVRYYIWNSKAKIDWNPKENKGVGIIEYDLTPVVEELNKKADKIDDTTPISKYLIETYQNYHKTILDEAQEPQKALFEDYKNNDRTKVKFDYKYFLKDFNSYISGDSTDLPNESKNKKTPTKKELVKDTVKLYGRALNLSNIFEFEAKDVIPDFKYDPDKEIDFDNNGKYDILEAVTNANEVVSKYEKEPTSYSDKGIESNAALFNDLVRYIYGKLSGANEKATGSTASDEREVDQTFENMLFTGTDLETKLINPALWEQVASMNGVSNKVKSSEIVKLLIHAQHLEYYASIENAGSGLDGNDDLDGSAKNKKLEKAIKEKEKEANDNNQTEWSALEDGDLIKQVKTYKQIKEGLDYIGIKPWTPNLIYICDLYDTISKFTYDEKFDDYDVDSEKEPLKRFFSYNNSEKKLSTNYMVGVALSSSYIPMQTNLYDPTSVRILKNEDWLGDFHIKYGFYRKALMIDTNVNAAVDNYITGSRDALRVATLKDLLEYKKDIVLYLDDNFYNADEAAEMTNKVWDRLANTEQAGTKEDSFDGFFSDLFTTNIEEILKTASKEKYDDGLIKNSTEYGHKSKLLDWDGLKESLFVDGILFSGGSDGSSSSDNDIKTFINKSDYSVKQSYAVLSGIYRHKDLANRLNTIAESPPAVFVSSPTLYNVNSINTYHFNSIYNYYMLRNLESAMGVDYKTTLDLDNPIYMDIYGNIITESGLVVIPAASNATLYPKAKYSNYTLGFMSLYSKGDNIPAKTSGTDDEIEAFTSKLKSFTLDEEGEFYLQKNYEFNGVPVNPQKPSLSDEKLIEVLYDNQVSILNNKGYDIDQRIWLITEVLRGAPLENIDKEKEGLVGKRDVNKYGLYMSWKLDEIADALLPTSNGNSIISMPNIAFMDGIEYVVLFAFKFTLLLFVIYIMYNIYIDAIAGRIGWRTLWNCVSTVAIFSICLAAIPNVISLSYNQTNKIFLQDEIKYINLLNYEKSLEGREISAVGVEDPKSQTKLYIKLDTISVPWYKVLKDVMFENISTKLEDIYEDQLQENSLYGYEDIEVVNDGAYISVDNIFSSSSIIYNNNQKFLYQNMNRTPTASYFIPYYYLLDNIISNINIFNRDSDIINISTKIQSDGSVKTMGMIGDYLLSEEFLLDAQDPLGLYDMYGIDTNEKTVFINAETDDYTTLKESMWYVRSHYEPEDISSRIDELYSYMRAYVAKNREMIGRVTDETFLKTMMLDISIKYNELFRIPAAKGIEVFNIDSRDLIRLSITDKNTSIVNSSYSFGKFIYQQSGGLGVLLTGILLGIYFITSIVKPALVIFLCLLLTYNMLIKNMIKLDKGKTVEGLLYLLAIMVIVNSIYAVLLKLSMSLPNLGLNPTISIIGQIGIQIVYLFFVYFVVSSVFKDMANMGYNIFHSGALSIAGVLTGAAKSVSDKALFSKEQQDYMNTAKMNKELSEEKVEDLEEEMKKRDKIREEAEEDTGFMETIFDPNSNTNNHSKDKDKENKNEILD